MPAWSGEINFNVCVCTMICAFLGKIYILAMIRWYMDHNLKLKQSLSKIRLDYGSAKVFVSIIIIIVVVTIIVIIIMVQKQFSDIATEIKAVRRKKQEQAVMLRLHDTHASTSSSSK